MDDASGHGGHESGHGGGRTPEPVTDIGRAMRDVLAAAPQFVATFQAKPDDKHGHGHDEAHADELDPGLRKLIDEIRDGLKQMRNPAGVVANCKDALKQLIASFGDLNGKPAQVRREAAAPHGALVGAVLIALAAVAVGFLAFGGHTDAAFAGGVDPDYRQLAYPAAVDTPNLASWLAWIVLALAVVGAAIWTVGRTSPAPRPSGGEHAGLKGLYDRGFISRDLYDRGRLLASDDPLIRPPAGENYAREFGAFVLALADTLTHRKRLGVASIYRDGKAEAGPSMFAARPKSGH